MCRKQPQLRVNSPLKGLTLHYGVWSESEYRMHKTKRAYVRLLIPKLNSSFPLIQLRVKTHAPLVRVIENSEGCSSISSCWLKASLVGQDGQPNYILPRNLPPLQQSTSSSRVLRCGATRWATALGFLANAGVHLPELP